MLNFDDDSLYFAAHGATKDTVSVRDANSAALSCPAQHRCGQETRAHLESFAVRVSLLHALNIAILLRHIYHADHHRLELCVVTDLNAPSDKRNRCGRCDIER